MASRRDAASPRSVSPTPRRTGRSTRLAAPPARLGPRSTFPSGLDDACYALKISGGSFAPLFRDGGLLIVSPHAPARPGDRVAVKTLEGELLIAELKNLSARTLELKPLASGGSDRVLTREEIGWMSRIIWASQ